MPRYQHVMHPPTLGLNEDDNKTALRDGELQSAVNVFHRGTVLHTRPGFIEDPDGDYPTDGIPVATNAVEGMYEFRKNFGSALSRTILVVHNGNVHLDYGSPATTLNLAGLLITANGGPWTMTQWQNTVLGAGGAAADDAWAIDATTDFTGACIQLAVDNSAGTPSYTPKLVFEKWNYVFCAKFYDINTDTVSTDSNANPLVVRYSDLGSLVTTDLDTLGESFPYSNAIGGPGIGGLSGNWGDWITGFGEYTDNNGDWLIIGTRNRLFAVRQTGIGDRPFVITDQIPNGLASQGAFVSLGVDSGDAIYLGPRGIHSVRQSQKHGNRANTFLSWPIRNTFDTINKARLNQVVGGYWPREGLVIFAVPTGSSPQNDKLLVLDIKNVGNEDISVENIRWYIWNLQHGSTSENISSMALMRDGDDESFLYAGTYTGDVLQMQTGTFSDQGADSDTLLGYSMKFRTKDMDFGVPNVEKQIGDVYVKMFPTGGYSAQMSTYFDFGRSSTSRQVNLGAGGGMAEYGTAMYADPIAGGDTYAISTTIARNKMNFVGSGEHIAFELSHTGANEPVGLAALSYEIAGLGEDTGDLEG